VRRKQGVYSAVANMILSTCQKKLFDQHPPCEMLSNPCGQPQAGWWRGAVRQKLAWVAIQSATDTAKAVGEFTADWETPQMVSVFLKIRDIVCCRRIFRCHERRSRSTGLCGWRHDLSRPAWLVVSDASIRFACSENGHVISLKVPAQLRPSLLSLTWLCQRLRRNEWCDDEPYAGMSA
jgi:hypothetical protein